MRSQIVNHHLLEIILWPNGDGTFKEIRNSASRLKELNCYEPNKMVIKLNISEHCKLHKPSLGTKRTYIQRKQMSNARRGIHKGGECFKGMKWKLVNGKRVWYNG